MTQPPAPAGTRERIALTLNRRIFYGWLMLGMGALAYFASGPAQSHTFSVFIAPISGDLAISRTSVSSAYALATLVAAFGLPYVGRLIDTFGVRVVLMLVASGFVLAQAGFAQVTGMALLTLGFGALRFLGQGSLMLCGSNLVSQWFNRRRGFALSLMSLGFALSMAVHPPLAQWLIDHWGWRQAWLWLALITLVLLLPAIVALIHNRPEDLGLNPDGVLEVADAAGASSGSAQAGLSLSEALRTRTFWIIAVSLGSLSMLVTGMFFHHVSILATQGLSPPVAASVFSVSALAMVVFMPVLGRLLDRYRTQYLFSGALIVMCLALLVLSAVRGVGGAMVYGVIFGLTNAALHTNNAFLWPRFFGRRFLGSIQGAGTTINVVGASLGPLPLGMAFDATGSYGPTLRALAVLPLALSVLVLFLREPYLNHRSP